MISDAESDISSASSVFSGYTETVDDVLGEVNHNKTKIAVCVC